MKNKFYKNALKAVAIFFALSIFSFQTLFALEENESTEKSELIMVDYENHYDYNPHTSAYANEAQILSGVYEGLFSYDPFTLEPRKALASDVHVSRNKLQWMFTIRDGAKFSDGSAIKAEDFKESWLDLIANPNAYYSSFLDIIKGAKEYRLGKGKREDVAIIADEENHLSVELVKPASHLTKILCHHAFAVLKKDTTNASGAYCFETVTPVKVVLVKNKNYWDETNVATEKITVLFSDDAEYNTHLFNTGSADWISGNFIGDKVLDKTAINFEAEFGTEYLFFKSSKAPWNNPDFRNALLTAIPWDALRAGHLSKAETLIHPLAGYQSPEGFNYTNKAEAASLLKKAKKSEGFEEDEKLVIKFAISDNSYMKQMAEILKKAWESLGVELEAVVIPQNLYLSSIDKVDADLFSYSWIGDFADPMAFLELFRSDSSLNETEWKNEEFDSLLEKASFTNNENEHYSLLTQAEDVLLSSGLIIPISHPIGINLINKNRVTGWANNALDMHPFKYIQINNDIPLNLPNVVKK